MEFKQIFGKTMFKPSFGGKKGTTDFYQSFVNGQRAGEIEIKPIGVNGKPEILSLYTDLRDIGVGRFMVKKTLDIYLDTEVYVMTTKESKPFWIKMGAEEIDGYLCVFKKKPLMEHIRLFEDFGKQYNNPKEVSWNVYKHKINQFKNEYFSDQEQKFLEDIISNSQSSDFTYVFDIYPISDEGSPGQYLSIAISKLEDSWYAIEKVDPNYSDEDDKYQTFYLCDQFDEVRRFLKHHTNLKF